MFPARTVVPEGVADSEKSAKKMEKVTAAVCPPPVPATVMFRGFAVVAERFVTVRVLEPPTGIELGLKVHDAPVLQDKAMEDTKVLGPAAETVKVAEGVPMRRTLERALVESEKTGLPVPVSWSDPVLTALESTLTMPVALPVDVGVKLTEMVQVWPTFNVAGTVGRLVPQLFVASNAPVAPMLVMVTA